MHKDISTIMGIATKASTSSQTSPGPEDNPSPDHPPHPRSQGKTSRHTQTQCPPQENPTKPSRPIRPLFPPCPWQTGVFPQGPVRQLAPSSQARAEPSGSRKKREKKASRPTTKERSHPDSFSPPPPSPHPSTAHCSPLIEELPTSSASSSSPSPPTNSAASAGPEDRNSLNF